MANYPGGTSVQNVRHWAQMIRRNLFSMYSFGSKSKNMQHYNQTEPPMYPIAQYPTTLPTAIIYGGTDKLANKNDVENLIQQLPAKPVITKYLAPYAHMDFPWGLTAIADFGSEVMMMMKKYNV
jgi:lysosomal acid lipase/cholesteryl ester hydrolase